MSRFQAAAQFRASSEYRLGPVRFLRPPSAPGRVLVSSLAGDWALVPDEVFARFAEHRLDPEDAWFAEFEARGFLWSGADRQTLSPTISRLRRRRQAVLEGPALHILVVTLRCDHSCGYCQVSRQGPCASAYDMSEANALKAAEHILASNAPTLTVEFQGGEPLLAFDTIRMVVEQLSPRSIEGSRPIRFVIASTLHHLTSEILAFCEAHDIHLSTSLDGPAWLHDRNRPVPTRDSHKRTIEGIALARDALGPNGVAALTTLTRASLEHPEAIVDEYVERGFHSIFLRPLSPYGFARRGAARQAYPVEAFLGFYRRAFAHILAVNARGYDLEEAYASLLLGQILTDEPHGYVDLRSPAAAGTGVRVYNYDGSVYASDEARMLAEIDDFTFRLGHVDQTQEDWLRSPAMQTLLSAGVAEVTPGCHDCAYLPFCGSDPIDSHARHGRADTYQPGTAFCARQMGLFDLLWGHLAAGDPETLRTFHAWVGRRSRQDLLATGVVG